MNSIKKISIVSIFILAAIPTFVHGQTQLEKPSGPGADSALVTCGGADQKPCEAQDAVNLIQNILNLTFMFAEFIVAAMFMYAGFLLITAVGDPGQIQKAKNIFKRTVIGFIIMFLSFVLVKNLLTNIGADKFFLNLISGDKNTSSNIISSSDNTATDNNVANTENLSSYFANLPEDYQSILDLYCVCSDGRCMKMSSSRDYVDKIFAILKTNIPIANAQSSIQPGTQKVIDSMKKWDMNKSKEVFSFVLTYKDGKTKVIKPKFEKTGVAEYNLNTDSLKNEIYTNKDSISEINTVHTHPPKVLEKTVETFKENYESRIKYLEKNATSNEEKEELRILKSDPLTLEYKKTDLAPPSSSDLLLDNSLLKHINEILTSIGYEKKIKASHYVVENNGVWTFSATPEAIKKMKLQVLCTELDRMIGSEQERQKSVQKHIEEIKKLGIQLEFSKNK